MKYLSFLILTVTTILFTGCGEKEINSIWKQSEITIDGNQSDWEGKLHYLSDQKSAIGIANDNDYLYLCLATNDTAKMFRFFSAGFTVWIESKNSDEKLGIQYPMRPGEMTGMMQPRNRQNESERPDVKVRLNEFKAQQSEIGIVNKDNFPLTVYPLTNELGLNVDLGVQMGLLVYEMKIPLKKDLYGGHNLKSSPGDELTIGFESGDFQRPNISESERPSGLGTGGRGQGRMGGSERRSPNFQTMEKIDFEIETKLATN